jgi:hypothetical protein
MSMATGGQTPARVQAIRPNRPRSPPHAPQAADLQAQFTEVVHTAGQDIYRAFLFDVCSSPGRGR